MAISVYVVLSSRSEDLENTVDICNLCRSLCQPVNPVFFGDRRRGRADTKRSEMVRAE